MRPDRLLLQDMLDAVNEVLDTTPSIQADFDSNKLIRSHVLRHLQIIGEAAWRVSGTLKDQHPEVPWKLIAAMRHILVHNYFEVNWNRVYDAARTHVPILKPQIVALVTEITGNILRQ